MIRSIFQLERLLTDALLEVPGLVRAFERKSPQAVASLLSWIDAVEALLSTHRLVAAAEVAGHKARVLAPTFETTRRANLRRHQQEVAISLLHELQSSVQEALRPHASRVAQARNLTEQLLRVLAQSGALTYDPSEPFEGFVDRIWALCQGHDQLMPFAAQLLSLLSADDVRLLLADTIEPTDFALGPYSAADGLASMSAAPAPAGNPPPRGARTRTAPRPPSPQPA